MSRDALVDGHRGRTVRIDLRILCVEEAEAVRRAAARHVCLKCCAIEIRIRTPRDAQHCVVLRHPCGHVERKPLKIRNALGCDSLRLAYDECVVFPCHICRRSHAAVEVCRTEVGSP